MPPWSAGFCASTGSARRPCRLCPAPRLDDAERSALADGIRFAAAYIGAIYFEQALLGGVTGPAMDARLDRLRNRIAVSQAVADLATRHLGAR